MNKQRLLIALIFLIFGQAAATQTSSPNSYKKVLCTETVFIYEPLSFIKDQGSLRLLANRRDLVVGHPNELGFEVYGDKDLYKILDELGLAYVKINFTKEDQLNTKSHPSFEEIEEKILDMSLDYSDIITLESIGDSVQGRPLWLVRMTKSESKTSHSTDPNVFRKKDLEKKHVFYIANIHGNEITGREIMILFIEDLAKKYREHDPEVLELLNTTVLHILPSLNPDGAEMRRRSNANYVDLNRDFPDWTRSDANTADGREPEVQALMEYYKQYEFSFSVNFHGGAEVVNYPWDNSPEIGPMEDLLEQVSLEYIANGADYMRSSFFPTGITRGYDWYPVYGGLQDWSTHYHNSPHLTIELSDDKWPHFDEMEHFFKLNRNSMIKAVSFF